MGWMGELACEVFLDLCLKSSCPKIVSFRLPSLQHYWSEICFCKTGCFYKIQEGRGGEFTSNRTVALSEKIGRKT
jgi:hypothetical protein